MVIVKITDDPTRGPIRLIPSRSPAGPDDPDDQEGDGIVRGIRPVGDPGSSFNWRGGADRAIPWLLLQLVRVCDRRGRGNSRPPSGNKYWTGMAEHPIYPYTVSYVYGEWTVPEIVPGTTGFMADVSVWVGIDGYDSNTVEQIGTDSEYNPSTGEATYSAWWEVYPNILPLQQDDPNWGWYGTACASFSSYRQSDRIEQQGPH
jgi:hypothetical protein